MKSFVRLLCLTVLLVLGFPAMADAPYKPSDIQIALNQHDFAAADHEIQAVLVAKPDSAVAHYWAAKILIEEHHAAEALAQIQKAQSLPPPHFKDPAKLTAFQGDLAKASTDLQKTIRDEESALAHPKTTTVTTTKIIPTQAAVASPLRQPPGIHGVVVLFIIGGLILLAILIVILVKLLFDAKPETVQVVHVADSMASRPDRSPVGDYGAGQRFHGVGSNPPPQRSTGFAMAAGSNGTPSSGHSTGAVVGAGIGGLAAGIVLDEMLHNRGSSGGFGTSSFGNASGSEEIDTTTPTGFDEAQVQQDYQQDDQDLSSTNTDDNFGSDSSGDTGGDSGSWGGDDS